MFAASFVLVLTFAAGLILPALFRLVKGCKIEEVSDDWLERFSSRSYYPMENLLSGDDFQFLSRQPGFDGSLYRKFRRDRLRIYHQYLHRMIADFNRLHLLARLLISQADTDQSALLTQLIHIKIRFTATVVWAEVRYALCCLGLRTASARELIAQLDELSEVVSSVAPVPAVS